MAVSEFDGQVPAWSENDGFYFSDLMSPYTPVNPKTGTCTRSCWDLSSFGFSFGYVAWNPQQCSYLNWAQGAAGGFGECIEPREASSSYASLEGPWASWTGPLELNLDGLSNLTVGAGSDDSVPSAETAPMRTPIAGSLAARELKRAWKNAKHQKPSEDVVLILTAHWAHETHGGRSMFNFNFGGIKGRGPDGLSCVREAHEGSGYHVRAMLDRFRAYDSAREGAEDYLSLLIRKYPEAIDAAERGDVTEFVAALKRGGYFTGSEVDYARSLSQLVVRASELGYDVLSRSAVGRE
jgi:hypothetical protein